MNVVSFHPRAVSQLNDMLEEAFHEEYEELILIGFRNGQVSIHHSGTISRARILGCLEMAKYDLLKDE